MSGSDPAVAGATIRDVIGWSEGTVRAVLREWPGVVEIEVALHPPSAQPGESPDTPIRPAIAYTALVGTPVVGDRVLLNDNAAAAGLGTAAGAVVVALPDRLPAPEPPPGHLVKARYTPLQTMVLGVDAQESEHHRVLADADDLAGLPVVAADLHSSLPAIIAGVRERLPEARVVYVMTDGGALPAAFSRTLAGLRATGWLDTTISTGQSYGGDLEAVTVHTGLLAAHLVRRADVVIVSQGPGNLGTGTRWGFSGVSAGEALNAAAVLGGTPIAALRVSQADERARHHGLSHHSVTAYGRVLARPADLVVPDLRGIGVVPGAVAELVLSQADELLAAAPHLRGYRIETASLWEALVASPVPLRTMGRGLNEDPAAFLTAAAAGRHAADHCVQRS